MPFALVIVGLLMIVTGVNNTYSQFGEQVRKDANGFLPYALAIGATGALGYFDALKKFSHLFLALILISLVLSNKGFFQNFTAGINAAPVAPTANATSAGSTGLPSSASVSQGVADAATGKNPGSDLIGSLTNQYLTAPFKSFFGLK